MAIQLNAGGGAITINDLGEITLSSGGGTLSISSTGILTISTPDSGGANPTIILSPRSASDYVEISTGRGLRFAPGVNIAMGTNGMPGLVTLDLESEMPTAAAWIEQKNAAARDCLIANWLPPDGDGKIISAMKQSATYAWFVDANRNMALGTQGSFGGGSRVFYLENAATAPSANPVGGGVMYVIDGKLMYKGSSGTLTLVAPA